MEKRKVLKFCACFVDEDDESKCVENAIIIDDLSENPIEKIEDIFIEANDPEAIYYLALTKDTNVLKLEKALIETGDVDYIFDFVKNVKGADVSEAEDAIIRINKPFYINEFAEKIKGANIKKLEDAIIATNNAMFIFFFAKQVKGADLDRLEDALLEFDDLTYYQRFQKELRLA